MSQENNHIGPKRQINKEFDIDILNTVLKKNWFWVPIFIVLFLSVALIYLRYTKPVYEASTIIQLGSIDEGKKIVNIENASSVGEELSSNVELLGSELILKSALKRLKLNVSYFAKGDILTEEKYTYSSYRILPLLLKDSAIVGRSIQLSLEDDFVILNYDFNGQQTDKIKIGQTYENEFFKILIHVKNKEQLLKSVAENQLYFTFNDFTKLARSYGGNLSVRVINPDAKTIEVKYRSNNPVLSKDIVESVVLTFFDHDKDKKQKGSANILSFITEQLDSISTQLEISEIQIKEYKQNNKVQDPKGISDNLLTRITSLEGQIVELDLERILLNTVESVLSDSPDRLEVYNLLPGIVGSQFEKTLTNQVEQLHELLLQLEDAKFSQTLENSNVKTLQNRVLAQSNTIKRMLGAFHTKLRVQKEEISKKIAEIEQSFYGIPEKEMELSRLERFFHLNEKYYVLLLEKKAQYSISKEGFTSSNLILKEVELPSSPISPRRNLITIGGVILGLLAGFILIFFRYVFYNEINSPEELKKLLNNRSGFLGMIPKLKEKQEYSKSVVFSNPKSSVSESFRTIRSNINFVSKNDSTLVIGVSSTIPSEGKTFVSINVASIYALSGKRTLLIDMDLRKPKVHLGFNLENNRGISDVLSGNAELTEVLQTTGNNLSIISAGRIPPNPYELILNGQLPELVNQLKKDFDVIIFDNPPVGVVSDGMEVLKHVDIPIFVFRSNFSKRIFANNISNLLSDDKLKSIYTVLNGFQSHKKDYGYNYGYGNYYEDKNSKSSLFSKLFRKN
ncbi:MAG: polysaccharide biosynthesis tyrosine autokinase [Crocinitomicaceae bacterium]